MTESDPYYVNGNPTLQYIGNGSDIRWLSGSKVDLGISLEYTTVDADGQLTTKSLALEQKGEFKDGYYYYKVDGGKLPPTDPYVATLTLTMSRMLEYDAYVYCYSAV